MTSAGGHDHVRVKVEGDGPGEVVLEDGERLQLRGDTVWSSDPRLTKPAEYSQYPGVVGGLAGVTDGDEVYRRKECGVTWAETDRDPSTGLERSRPGR